MSSITAPIPDVKPSANGIFRTSIHNDTLLRSPSEYIPTREEVDRYLQLERKKIREEIEQKVQSRLDDCQIVDDDDEQDTISVWFGETEYKLKSNSESLLVRNLGNIGREAWEIAKNQNARPRCLSTTFERVQHPGPDYLPEIRTYAKILSYLVHDTPERQSLLQKLGIDPSTIQSDLLPLMEQEIDQIDPRKIAQRKIERIAGGLLAEADNEHSLEEWCWQKQHQSVDPVPETEIDDETKLQSQALKEAARSLDTRRLSSVFPKKVNWLWPQRFAYGKVSMLSGDPGIGKTWLILDVIARITTGRDFPDSINPLKYQSTESARRNVLWVSGEDDLEDTIVPRLLTLAADVSRVHSLDDVNEIYEKKKDNTTERHRRKAILNLGKHIDQLGSWLYTHPLVSLVVIDPITAFLGKIDSHNNSSVRALMTPLFKLAAKHQVAIIGLNHLNKSGLENAMYRGMGSIAFVAATRASWLLSVDPKEHDRRIFTEIKGNNREDQIEGLAFRIGKATDNQGKTLPPIRWEDGTVKITANEALLSGIGESARTAKRMEAKQFLTKFLADGPAPAKWGLRAAKAIGLSEDVIDKARKELGIVSQNKSEGHVWTLPSSLSTENGSTVVS